MTNDQLRLEKLLKDWNEVNKPRHVSKIFIRPLPQFSQVPLTGEDVPFSDAHDSQIASELASARPLGSNEDGSSRTELVSARLVDDDDSETGTRNGIGKLVPESPVEAVRAVAAPTEVRVISPPRLPGKASVGIVDNPELKDRIRAKRITRIYSGFCDYLLFRLVRQQLLTSGFPMEKLQENNPGKISRVSLGVDVDTACIWWDHGLSRHHVLFKDILRIDYSQTSPCFINMQTVGKFSKNSIQSRIAPWNCFSIVTGTRSFDFYSPPSSTSRPASPGGKMITENSIDVENFLFGLSYVLNEHARMYTIGGVFRDKKHLILIRGRIKLNQVLHKPGGKDGLIGQILVTSFDMFSSDAGSGENSLPAPAGPGLAPPAAPVEESEEDDQYIQTKPGKPRPPADSLFWDPSDEGHN